MPRDTIVVIAATAATATTTTTTDANVWRFVCLISKTQAVAHKYIYEILPLKRNALRLGIELSVNQIILLIRKQ